MATVTLDEGWLHDAANLATFVRVDLSSVAESAEIPADVRRYAGGRLRLVTKPGPARTVSVACKLADRAAVDTLRSWVGRLLLYRDPTGRKVWSMFGEVSITEIPGGDSTFADCSFVLREVSHTEAV